MPQNQEKQKVNSNPSPGLLRKLLGGQISESTQNEWPELAKEWASAEVNMPRETAMVNHIGPMGLIERNLPSIGNASGRSNLGNISLNRSIIDEDKNLRDTIVHELTHVGQKPRGIIQFLKDSVTPWDKVPLEQEAIKAEQNYPWKSKGRDTVLPIDTAPTTMPVKSSLVKPVNKKKIIAS